METMRLSEHFTTDDLLRSYTASKYHIEEQYNPPAQVINELKNLCIHVLDPVKEQFPDLLIDSGYRCERLNKMVGGVVNSQHLRGQAADIDHPDNDSVFEYIKTLNFDQLILYDDYIHVSYNLRNNRRQIIDKLNSKEK
jgi:hypothetical protein